MSKFSCKCLAGLLIPLMLLSADAWGQSDDVARAIQETPIPYARASEIDAMLTKYFKPDEPGVSVIVTLHGTTLFRKGYGMADVEKGLPMHPGLPLRVGSITKQFTAAAIMLLAEQGKLAVSDEISKYLPEFPLHGRHITIEHLLTHTSGIRNYTALPAFGTVMDKDVGVDEAIAFFKDTKPEFQPGQRFSYSNSNYFLLGAIIEQVSGMTYPDFLQRQIFQPLQMDNTVIEQSSTPPTDVVGYTQTRKGSVRVPHYSMRWPFAAGALRTSIDDLARWDAAITSGLLLKAESWSRMATNYTLAGGGHTGYGYGWFIRQFSGSDAIEHGGDIGGYSADMWCFPKEAIFIAVLANNDAHDPAPDAISEKIAKIVLRH